MFTMFLFGVKKMNNRITKKFNQLKAANRGGFFPFIVAGATLLKVSKKKIL